MVYYILAAIMLSGILLLTYMAFSAFRNKLVEAEILFENFPGSFGEIRIFFISDIHRRKINDNLIMKAKGKADLVIIGGDLREKGVPLERVKDNLVKLKSIAPVFFVWGNNDYEGDYRALDALLLEMNVKILDNTSTNFLSPKGDRISLLGIDDYTLKKDRLDLALMDADKGSFRILASHNPGIIEKISHEQEISFVLSGHTHGGQIRIFGYGPYKKGKLEKKNGLVVLTSNGYGTTSLPLRLGAPAECHLITLKHGVPHSNKD